MGAALQIIGPVLLLVAVGWVAAKAQVLRGGGIADLSNVVFVLFMPALLFLAMARMQFDARQLRVLAAYYSAALLLFALAAVGNRWRKTPLDLSMVRAISACFSNSAMVGIPIVSLAFGEPGLRVALGIIAMHALVLITLATVIVEAAYARQHPESRLLPTIVRTMRNAIVHPVVLPIVVGLLWGAMALPLPLIATRALEFLGQAGPPAALVLLGATLANMRIKEHLLAAAVNALAKTAIHPLLAWAIAHWVFGLNGLPLAVISLCAALPAGANAYLFAQRYAGQIGEAGVNETSATVVLSTVFSLISLTVVLTLLGTGPL